MESQKIIVCGGHETWLKTFRGLCGKAKYIGKESVFDPALIRNADVVWIQPNAISHKQFGRIINIARAHNIPVRYFKYASAQKCVEQMRESAEV